MLVWFLFEHAGYSLASVLSNAVLLLAVILFFWPSPPRCSTAKKRMGDGNEGGQWLGIGAGDADPRRSGIRDEDDMWLLMAKVLLAVGCNIIAS